MLTKDDLKAILDTISPFIDARARTTETLIRGEITGAKEELEAHIVAARAEAKLDSLKVQTKLDKAVNDHAERVEVVEKQAGIPHPHKH